MKRFDCLKLLALWLDEHALTVTSRGGNAREWAYLRPQGANFHSLNMGTCMSFAVGLALAFPKRKVIAIDSDGSLLLDTEFNSKIEQAQAGWRVMVSTALQQGLPVLAMSSSLGYFDMYRTANLPLNLTQAQRDFFGSHTYERVDKPEQGFVHTEWEELLEKQ